MTATTSSKKNIVDFLWEWGESNGDWGKLLVQNIVTTESQLIREEREKVYNYFLLSIGLLSNLPALSNHKPTYSFSTKKIDITSLSEVSGINKLAKDQTIDFSKNVTVVYGENGSGKTGYGRILKALGYSYDPANIIYNDIYKAKEPRTATIKYNVDGTDLNFIWDGNNKNDDLQNISVFNNNCVQISIADNRGLLVSPIGFHLFSLITFELGQLAEMLQKHLDKHPTLITWQSILHPGTPQEQYVTNLKGNSSVPKLEEIGAFKEEHLQKLSKTEQELKNLNKQLLDIELLQLKQEIGELNTVIAKINKAKRVLSEANLQKLIDISADILTLENKETVGIKEIAETNGIQFYTSQQFTSFIKAADEYLKILGKEKYPESEKETCIYCQQELVSEKSKDLLSSYHKLLSDNTQDQIKNTKETKTGLIAEFLEVDTQIVLQHGSFGIDGELKAIQPTTLIDYNKTVNQIISEIKANQTVSQAVSIAFEDYISIFETRLLQIEEVVQNKSLLLENIVSKEKELQRIIIELQDRRSLSGKLEEIKTIITNKSLVSKLLGAKSQFSTNAISRKTTEAREALLQQNFNSIFENELKDLRKSSIKIQINFGTDKGKSKMQQRLNSSFILSEILSDGEQKAIALAEFLTELQLDNSKAPVIFDDPVNSLDHHIIDDVARRLLALSKGRQVVIFTHSVLLFNSLLHLSKASFKEIESNFYNIKSEFGKTGIITKAEEELDKVNVYIKQINTLLNNTPKERTESDIASDGYGYLRSAIELCVEHNIFKGTVKRYQKNVALTNFLKVDGGLLNKHKDKLNEVFERCCAFIKGHSSPTEIITEPTLEDLKGDFDIFKDINQQFQN